MELFFAILHVLISVGLVFLILLHSGKDTGMSGMAGIGGGGGGPLGGGAMLEKNLNRWTVGFAIAFFLTTAIITKV